MQEQINKRIYQILVTVTVLVIVGGTVFYHLVEKFTWVNAYYFCVVSLTTVGYGDITPHTNAGKIFTTVYLVVGIIILGAFFNAIVKRRGDKMTAKQTAIVKAREASKE